MKKTCDWLGAAPKDTIKYPDQDAINNAMSGMIRQLPVIYNAQISNKGLLFNTMEYDAEKVVVLHFASGIKPWHGFQKHALNRIFSEHVPKFATASGDFCEVALSVIMPVFNGTKTLRRILDILVAQTLTEDAHMEIICIDDGSTDESADILREYADKNPNIKIISFDKNAGVSAARNAGLSAARGAFVGFVDCDDTVADNFFEELYKRAIYTKADIIAGTAVCMKKGFAEFIVSVSDIAKDKFFLHKCFWRAIYRRSLFDNNGIMFDENLCIGEDDVFLITAVLHAKKVEAVEHALYTYYIHENSAMHGEFNEKKAQSLVLSQNMIIDIAQKNRSVIGKDAYQDIVKSKMWNMTRFAFGSKSPQIRKYLYGEALRLSAKIHAGDK
jgi:glycosyltransferase EpsJ